MKSFLTNPELSLSLNFASPFKPSLSAKLPVSWGVVMAVFAVLLLFYLAGKLESKASEKKD